MLKLFRKLIAIERIVDNRVFLLGLDKMYRRAMMRHEEDELLTCARRVATVLAVSPAAVPVEGYYTENKRLTEYFLLMRALQTVPAERAPSVAALPEFTRLLAIASSPLYGIPSQQGKLLPAGYDALARALKETAPVWTVEGLVAAAGSYARATDDFSLAGLAARAGDAVVLAALRESVVLYQLVELGSAMMPRIEEKYVYVWKVDQDLAGQARKFIDTFNELCGEHLPGPDAKEAESYWHACACNEIRGRCVRIGRDTDVSPPQNYHWAIYNSDSETLAVHEFWHPELWTTQRYRACLPSTGVPREFNQE